MKENQKTTRGKEKVVRNRRPRETALATLKRLKRGDENELERKLRLEKVVASKQLRLAVETEEEEEQDWRMMQLPNGSGWPWRWTKKE